ncbi:MAG: TetR/AcrR family transcriptional regulator [Armatimonadota bacterium]
MKTCTLKEDTRDAILDAVRALLIRYGYRKMTVDDIAREAGIGKGSVYLFFASKEEMALGVIDRTNQKLLTKLREIAENTSAPPDKIRELLFERVLTRFDAVQQCTEGLDDLYAAIRPKLLEKREYYQNIEAKILQDVLNMGKRSGCLAFGDAEAAAHALLSATNAFLPYSLSAQQLGDRHELMTKLQCMADILLYGLVKGDTSNG